jgi:hypothetical protein
VNKMYKLVQIDEKTQIDERKDVFSHKLLFKFYCT